MNWKYLMYYNAWIMELIIRGKGKKSYFYGDITDSGTSNIQIYQIFC